MKRRITANYYLYKFVKPRVPYGEVSYTKYPPDILS